MHSETADAVGMLDGLIRSRSCVRAFRPDPVPRLQLIEILETARVAPSNFNWSLLIALLRSSRAPHFAHTILPANDCVRRGLLSRPNTQHIRFKSLPMSIGLITLDIWTNHFG